MNALMTFRWLPFVLLMLLLSIGSGAHAAYSCSVSSPGFNRAYDPTLAGWSTQQTYVTVNCTRSAGDAAALDYSIAADNGQNPKGINNQAAQGGNFIRYDVYVDSACGVQWKGNRTLSGTLNFGGGLSASVSVPYWGCILAGQTGLPGGIYTDSVRMTLTYGSTRATEVTTADWAPVQIATPWTCSMSLPPGNVVLGYVSFGPAVTASTSFAINCTAFLPYTLSLDVATGTIAGLNYTLSLSTTSVTGTGSAQTHMIDGTMSAGQAGTCGTATCSGTNAHTLTLTY